MTFQPIWPWWIMGPVVLAGVAFLAWTAECDERNSGTRRMYSLNLIHVFV